MRFFRIDATIAICKAHLDATSARGTPIESFLVGYVLAVIYAEFEDRIPELFRRRVCRGVSVDLHGLLNAAIQKTAKRTKISDIAGALAMLKEDWKTAFQREYQNTPSHTAYDSLINNRHFVAHAAGTQMSFAELEAAYVASAGVFDALIMALEIVPDEIADLL